jgi:hypothetical protein
MVAVRATAALEGWGSLEATAAQLAGTALFELRRFGDARDAFAAALDIRTGAAAPTVDVEASRFALAAATRRLASSG